MKKKSLLTILSAIFLLSFFSSSIQAQKSADLKYNLDQGDQYDYLMTTDADITFDANGMVMTLENLSTFESVATIQKVSENKFTIETQIKRIKSTQKMFGMEINYDSDDPSTAQNPMTAQIAAAFSNSIDKTYTMVMDEKGEMSEIDMSQLAENEDIAKSINSGVLYAVYPDQKVKIGDSWEQDIVPVKESDMKVHAKYTLIKLSGKTATIRFDGIISANTMQNMEMKMDGTQKGEMIIDVNTGWLIESTIDQDIELDIEQNGQKFPATIGGTIKTTSTKK